jgi:L-threonylcarbamoyladenylate synthase
MTNISAITTNDMLSSTKANSTASTKVTESIAQAAQWLQQGSLLAYPTESVWGIGCDAYNQKAVQQILAIKQRPAAKGMIVITDSSERLTPFLTMLTAEQRELIVASWQEQQTTSEAQAHTWLLPVPTTFTTPIPHWITGEHQSIAVRVIAHPLIRQICEQMVSEDNPFGFIVSTSCNPSGQDPATTLAQAYAHFGEQIGYLAAPTLGYKQPSQIRDALTGRTIR